MSLPDLGDYLAPSLEKLLHLVPWIPHCIEHQTKGEQTVVRVRSSGTRERHRSQRPRSGL